MIEKIRIREVATYDATGIEIGLDKINYIFGSNGTGKTTISEFLRNSNDQKYFSCSIEWKRGGSNFDIFVYNRHFVEENFNIHNDIKGIFTLGKESVEILSLIDKKRKDVEKHKERIESLNNNIKEKKEQLESLKINFMNQCWDLKQRYGEIFQEAFSGLRNNKKKFMEKCLEEATTNNSKLFTYEELNKRVDSVFKSSREKIRPIPEVHYDSSFENKPIFQTYIIGKSDIDIASLISKLNISDWVKQGHKHLEGTDGICPFCQQELPVGFKEKLDEYFDETYSEQIHILNTSVEDYKRCTNEFFEKYNFLIVEDIPFINKEKIVSLFEIMNSIYKENIQLLEKKKKEPRACQAGIKVIEPLHGQAGTDQVVGAVQVFRVFTVQYAEIGITCWKVALRLAQHGRGNVCHGPVRRAKQACQFPRQQAGATADFQNPGAWRQWQRGNASGQFQGGVFLNPGVPVIAGGAGTEASGDFLLVDKIVSNGASMGRIPLIFRALGWHGWMDGQYELHNPFGTPGAVCQGQQMSAWMPMRVGNGQGLRHRRGNQRVALSGQQANRQGQAGQRRAFIMVTQCTQPCGPALAGRNR